MDDKITHVQSPEITLQVQNSIASGEMSSIYNSWTSPLSSRYASNEMLTLFSPRTRFSTWRSLWIWLAQAEKELGLDISDDAISQMKAAAIITDPEFKVAAEEERRRRHDVMAHVYTFGKAAPAADGIIHW